MDGIPSAYFKIRGWNSKEDFFFCGAIVMAYESAQARG